MRFYVRCFQLLFGSSFHAKPVPTFAFDALGEPDQRFGRLLRIVRKSGSSLHPML
jgi:hypothetical protein